MHVISVPLGINFTYSFKLNNSLLCRLLQAGLWQGNTLREFA